MLSIINNSSGIAASKTLFPKTTFFSLYLFSKKKTFCILEERERVYLENYKYLDKKKKEHVVSVHLVVKRERRGNDIQGSRKWEDVSKCTLLRLGRSFRPSETVPSPAQYGYKTVFSCLKFQHISI